MKLSERIAESVGRVVIVSPDDDGDREELLADIRDIYMRASEMEASIAYWKVNHAELREKLTAAGNEIHELRENLEMVAKLRDDAANELARYKSSSHWAVTCEGMDRDDAVDAAHRLYQRAGVEHKAVPLAPEDGI